MRIATRPAHSGITAPARYYRAWPGIAALALLGCGAAIDEQRLLDEQLKRQPCYLAADTAAWSDAEQNCFAKYPDKAWEDCPERARILRELDARYKGCK